MNKDLHNIDDVFKNAIDGHAEEVPPDVWKNIDHSLDKKQAAFYKKKYFAVRAAAILLILVGGVTIAAILRLHQHGKAAEENSANQNTVTTSNERKNRAEENTIQKKAPEDLIVEEKKDEKLNTVFNKSQDRKQINQLNDAVVNNQKVNSEKYAAENSDIYSAQEKQEVPVANRNKSVKQNKAVKYKPVSKSSVDLVEKNQNNSLEKTVEQHNSSLVETDTIKDVQRITHVDANLLGINKIDLTRSLFTNSVNGSPISLSTALSNPKAIRLKNHFRSWSISPMYAQNLNLNTLKDDYQFRDPRNNSREAKRTEQETTSFSIGLGVQKQISRSIFLQSGIQYFSSRTNIQPKTIFAKPDARGDVRFQFYCSSGQSYLSTKNGTTPVIGDSIKTNFSESALSYLQVPLLIAYVINFGRFSLIPSAGIQTNFLLSGKLNSHLEHPTGEEEVSSSIDGLRSAYLSGVLQPQLNYKISDRVSFDFNPNINFSLSPINKKTAVKTYQNMFSIGAGIRIKL